VGNQEKLRSNSWRPSRDSNRAPPESVISRPACSVKYPFWDSATGTAVSSVLTSKPPADISTRLNGVCLKSSSIVADHSGRAV
jgi:hypothetical protein